VTRMPALRDRIIRRDGRRAPDDGRDAFARLGVRYVRKPFQPARSSGLEAARLWEATALS